MMKIEYIKEEDINKYFIQVNLNTLSEAQFSNIKNHPTHFSRTLQKNGFDKVKYYKKIK